MLNGVLLIIFYWNITSFPYLDTTLAAVDLRALTASECVSSATAERIKPSSRVNTVTELDFLPTPNTWNGHYKKTKLATFQTKWMFRMIRWFWFLTNLTMCGKSSFWSLACVQDLGSCDLIFSCLVLDSTSSRNVILLNNITSLISCIHYNLSFSFYLLGVLNQLSYYHSIIKYKKRSM